MLTNPGATASPVASITVFAFADLKSPTPAIRSPRIPTSARFGSAPLPSKTVPPLIITSKSAAPGDGDGSFANIASTIVTKTARQKKFRFTELIQEASITDVDLKTPSTDNSTNTRSYAAQQTPVAGAQHESVVDKVPTLRSRALQLE